MANKTSVTPEDLMRVFKVSAATAAEAIGVIEAGPSDGGGHASHDMGEMMEELSSILGADGVQSGWPSFPDFWNLNMGGPYVQTLICNGEFSIGCYGDFLEELESARDMEDVMAGALCPKCLRSYEDDAPEPKFEHNVGQYRNVRRPAQVPSKVYYCTRCGSRWGLGQPTPESSWGVVDCEPAWAWRDDGADTPETYRGAGVHGTDWSHCYVGVGTSAEEAAEDALEQAAADGWVPANDVEIPPEFDESQVEGDLHRYIVLFIDKTAMENA